jgi:curved DNA-binding protein CbpA
MKQIKSSFRKLAMKFHPDKNKTEGAEVIFQELSEAYSIIGDVEKKAEYDELFRHFYELEHEDSDIHPSDDEKPAQPEPQPTEASQQTKEKSEDKQESSKQEKPETSKKEDSDFSEDFKNLKEDNEELDDETLFKVLKFLAENDYIITKRTRRVPAPPTSEQSNERPNHESRSRRSTDPGDGHRTYTEYKTSSQDFHKTAGGHGGHKGHGHNFTGGHKGHDHAWTNTHQHKPRAEHKDSRYSQQFHGSEQVYCRSTTRWEGNVKISSKTCY